MSSAILFCQGFFLVWFGLSGGCFFACFLNAAGSITVLPLTSFVILSKSLDFEL